MCHRSTRQRSCCSTARANARYGCCWRAHNSRSHRSCLLVLSLPRSLSPSWLLDPCSARLDSSDVSSVCLNILVLSPTPPALPSPLACGASLHTCFVSLPPTTAARWGVVATGLCGEKQAPRPRQPPALHPTIPLHRPRRERGPAHEREGCVCGGGEVLSSACTPLHGFRPPSRGRTLLPRASECV